jgi:hypothetical protein
MQGLFTPMRFEVGEDRKQFCFPIRIVAVLAFLNLASPKNTVPLPILMPRRRARVPVYKVLNPDSTFQ